ncbi:MAG: hypothetical protein M1820_003920 [Bogoriella megaspora]|nr:MAG: hypothetical protein M1820_003920 [Bogoriella megaspora]
MMRPKPFTAMQKTYDDCYLICSTAVYFENQNNETEALRSWRNALDQIYYHNAYRVPANYQPKTETEKALQDSLRDMELQCKERVDLLEALKKSRAETSENGLNAATNTTMPPPPPPHQTARTSFEREKSPVLGQGAVNPVEYLQLPRPSPPLPVRPGPRTQLQRPLYTSRKSSDSSVPLEKSKSASLTTSTVPPTSNSPAPGASGRKVSRTPSPEKRGGMLKTLRPGRKDNSRASSANKMPTSLRSRPPAAAKAATQAWGSLPRMGGGPSKESLTPSDTLDGNSGTGPIWDPYTRRLIKKPSGEDLAERPSSRAESPPTPLQNEPPGYEDPRNTFIGGRRSEDGSVDVSKLSILERNSIQGDSKTFGESSALNGHNQHVTGTSRTSQRPTESQPQLPKLDPRFLSYRKEYPSSPAHPSQVALAEKRRLAPSSSEDDPIQAPSEEVLATRPSPSGITRKAVQVTADSNLQRPSANSREPLSPPLIPRKSKPDTASKKFEKSSRKVTGGSEKPDSNDPSSSESISNSSAEEKSNDDRIAHLLKNLPKGVDSSAAKQIVNEIVVQGDEVHWSDIAGLDIAKDALKETVVYPFLRPDLFSGLREPARGMLLFGPPGTGKTMLARAVATESRSTFFAISASSLTSKFLGESEKLVRALFAMARALAPSIIFVDEIDSLLSVRSSSGEHEATRRIKTEFLIQWSDLAKAAAGRESLDKDKGDASRVLVLAATNMPWAIDEAARRRFVRRQYIPLPENHVRKTQLGTLLSHQKHDLTDDDLEVLVQLTDGFSGSDITALAKDAAMGPLRSLGEKLLHMSPEDIRPICFDDFEASLVNIRPSVSRQGLKEYEQWAKDYGERGG